MINDALRWQVTNAGLNPVDAHFAEMLARLAPGAPPEVVYLFAQLSHALSRQHSCLDLTGHDNREALLASVTPLPIVATPEHPDRPLVLDGHRLYMQRYFRYETQIAGDLVARNRMLPDVELAPVFEAIRSLFPGDADGVNWQQVAAVQALTRQLAIITGGPGTGKTTTVVKILEAIVSLSGDDVPLIRLAAPTGKAAMRLTEAIRDHGLAESFEVQTLHRLLGMRANGRSYRHGPDYPLNVDLLIVDEVSMIDVAMMHRLLSSLPPTTRLILLGDPGQLPSVEAGNILADICKYPAGFSPEMTALLARLDITVASEETGHGLSDAVSELQQSHRFSPDRGIGRLSRAIRSGEDITLLSDSEVGFEDLAGIEIERFADGYEDYAAALRESADPLALITAFEQSRVLGPLRDGPFGVEAINQSIESTLEARGVIDARAAWYHGRPILVTRNDYNLRLFNGDIGICIEDESSGEPLVVFRDAKGEARVYLASRLPPHETCFAMTIHKSQGSEFGSVMLIVPTPATSPGEHLMTRELIYTAVTRARDRLRVFYQGDALRQALARSTTRFSGLGDRFLDGGPDRVTRSM